MAVLPPSQRFTAAITNAEAKDALNAVLEGLRQNPFHALEETLTIVSGAITPLAGMILLETEGGAATDALTNIVPTNFADGQIIVVGIANPARTVTVANMAGGSGQINISDDADLGLSLYRQKLWLKKQGSTWVEVSRTGMTQPGSVGNPVTSHMDFSGFSAFNVKPLSVTVSAATLTVSRSLHSGRKLNFTNAGGCVVTLPSSGWFNEDRFEWEQKGSSLTFVGASGVAVVNALNHDRGAGVGSMGVCWVRSMSPPVEWGLQGLTTALSSNPLHRTIVHASSSTSVTTDAASTAWKDGLTLAHTPGSLEKWIYFFSPAFRATFASGQNLAQFRVTENDVTVAQYGRERYGIHTTSAITAYYHAYGASPVEMTFKMQIAAGDVTAGYSATMLKQSIIGLKLEANEGGGKAEAEVTSTDTVNYADGLSWTLSASATDYVIGAYCDWDVTNGTGSIEIRVLQDGVEIVPPREMVRNGSSYGGWSALLPVTLTAGSKAFKIQYRPKGAYTAKIRNQSMYALRKGAFSPWSVSDSPGEEALTSSTTLTNKVTVTASMISGFNHLVLADMHAYSNSNSAGHAIKAELWRNGSVLFEPLSVGTAVNGFYTPTGPSMAILVAPALSSDTFEYKWAAAGGAGEQVKVADGTIAVIPLAPAS